jgi:hypothetical protein
MQCSVRCSFFDRILHSRIPLVPTPARMKLVHVRDQWHSSRVSTIIYGSHVLCRHTTEGTHPLVVVDSSLTARFSNCEIRPMVMSQGPPGEDGRLTINLEPAPPAASQPL